MRTQTVDRQFLELKPKWSLQMFDIACFLTKNIWWNFIFCLCIHLIRINILNKIKNLSKPSPPNGSNFKWLIFIDRKLRTFEKGKYFSGWKYYSPIHLCDDWLKGKCAITSNIQWREKDKNVVIFCHFPPPPHFRCMCLMCADENVSVENWMLLFRFYAQEKLFRIFPFFFLYHLVNT